MGGKREALMEEIRILAGSRANDAVRLALMGEGALEELDGMDLAAVTEFKRGANGAIEVKLVDRLEALRWLAEHSGGDGAERLYEAMERGAGE